MATYNPLSLIKSIEWAKQLGVAAFYALLIYIGDSFFESDAVIAHLELASGFALAALLIGGQRYVVGVLLGAAMAHMVLGAAIWEIAIVATSDALQALCGIWLLMHEEKFDLRVQSLRDYFRLILLGGCISIAISALVANTLLLFFGFVAYEDVASSILHWWMSDTLGVILVTPLILVWWGTKCNWHEARQMVEAVLLLGLTILVGQIVFLDWMHDIAGSTAKSYWMFMLITWVAMFLGTRGTTVALLAVAVQALFGATQGVGYFADDIEQVSLLNYWFYILTLSLVGMSLATYVHEIKQANFAVAHRDALIREIHHRIKNNIQGITGLLRQLAEKQPNIREDIDQTIGQVQSIATIHGLQERTAVDDVELSELVCAVASGVGSLWGSAIHVEVPPGWKPYVVDAAETVPLALILNELLSNAIKHGEQAGPVNVALKHGRVLDFVHVVIRNAGQLPPNFERDTGTGMQLVKSLLPREGARISWHRRGNTVITLLKLEPPVITSGHES
ncbi:MAG: MASE1 domain-containing protein [Gallionella sp.]|jgi:two-component sensor histidine kinase|nr:MASE1 domain-containing protein [Gallionella sp.]MCK9353303.1 MASE1 domain-containing protein [Gallionella sp.]